MEDLIQHEAIEDAFPRVTWGRGELYFAEGRVVDLTYESGVWEAHVRGTRRDPYFAWVAVDQKGKRVRLDGDCSCPAPLPCKHMAALVCAARARPPIEVPELDPGLVALGRWAERVEKARAAQAGGRPSMVVAASDERLVYVLRPRAPRRGEPSSLAVEGKIVRPHKRGGLTRGRRLDLDDELHPWGRASHVVTDEDRVLWFRLRRTGEQLRGYDRFSSAGFALDAGGAALFHDYVATGRCHHLDTANPALRWGGARAAEIAWELDAQGRHRVRLIGQDPAGRVEIILPLHPPHYLDPHTGETGPLELALPDALAAEILELPPLEPQVVAALPEALGRVLDAAAIPRPVALPVRRLGRARAQPMLTLSGTRGLGAAGAHARASVDYGALRVGFEELASLAEHPGHDGSDPSQSRRRVIDGEVVEFDGDPARERGWLADLQRHGFSPERTRGRGELELPSPGAWLSLYEEGIAELEAKGWQVDVEPEFPFELVSGEAWYMDVEPSQSASDSDWFALELGVEIEGQRVNLLPIVVDAIGRGELVRDRIRVSDESIRLPLGDGRWVRLSSERLGQVLDVLVELFDERLQGGRLRLRRLDGGRLLGLEGIEWRGAQALRKLAGQLTRREPLPRIKLPRTLKTDLRDYQAGGLDWLALLRTHGFGGVLADDMGLGKTVQALAHLLVEKRARRLDRPCLVVAPRSVIANWARECERFAPTLTCGVYHGPDRAEILSGKVPDLVVTTYALLLRDAALRERDWHVVVLDEAQAIKNPRTKLAAVARQLSARQRLCLTGTPMENNLEELWSLFTFAVPGLLGDLRGFTRRYRRPIERDADAGRMAALSARIAPFMLRRTKSQVLTELPPKTEVLVSVPLERRQRDLYESVRMTMEKRVREALQQRGLAKSHIVVLDALLKLRQVCCHPALVKSETARRSRASSAKTERLMELLSELLAEGRRTIVFSQFTSMLDIVEGELARIGVACDRITGRTRKRQHVVDAFQAGEFPVLLISLKAGGTGINLTAADTVIHYDPWWNPAVEDQATDRTHRIGQTRPITVYRLVCEGTVEQRVLGLQDRKRQLTHAVQRGAEQRSTGGLTLAPEDVELLLLPLSE